MAEERDEILLHVRALTEGQQDVLRLGQSVAKATQDAAEAQKKSAAASTIQANAFLNLHTRTVTAIDSLNKFQTRLYAAGTAATAVAGAFGSMSAVISAGADYEKWETAFNVMLGGADAAQKRLAELTDFARVTPFTLPQVIEASKLLEALGLSTDKYLATLGNVAAFMDRDLKDAVIALGDAAHGIYEPLKTFGVDITDVMERAHVKFRESGRRTTEENQRIVTALIGMWQDKFGGGMEALSKTTSGKLSNIEDAWFRFRLAIAQGGVGEAFSTELQKILDKIDELEQNGTLERWARQLSGGLESVLSGAESLGGVLARLKSEIVFLIGASVLGAAAPMLTRVVEAMIAASAEGTVLTVVVRGLGVAVAGLGGPIGIVLSLLGGLAALNLAGAIGQVDRETDHVRKLSDALDEANAKQARLETGVSGSRAAFAGPTPAQAAGSGVRTTMQDLYGQKPGEGFGDFAARLRTQSNAIAPPTTVKPPAPHVDEEAEKKAFEAAKAALVKLVAASKAAQAEVTRDFEAAVTQRLDLAGAEGQARVRLIDTFGKQEIAQLLEGGAERTRLEADLERRIAAEREEIRSSAAATGVKRRLLQDLDAEERAQKQGIALAFESGTLRAALEEKLGEDERQARAERLRKESEEAARFAVADAQFERDLLGQTNAVYVAALTDRMAQYRADSAAYNALLEERLHAEQDAAQESTAREVNLAKLERDAHGMTTHTFLALLEARRSAYATGADEYIELTRRMAAATSLWIAEEHKAVLEAQRLRGLGVSPTTAQRVAEKGVTVEQVAGIQQRNPWMQPDQAAGVAEGERHAAEVAAATERQIAEDVARLQDLATALDDYFTHLAGGWHLVGTAARDAFGMMQSFGTATFNKLEKEFERYFHHHKTQHALLAAIARTAAKEAAAGELEALAAVERQKAKHYAAEALAALAKGFLEHDPSAFIAAAKYGAAAVLYGGIAAVASAGAAELHRSAEQEGSERPQTAGGGARGSRAASDTGEPGVRTVGLAVSSADRQIVNNFYSTLSFEGGTYFMGGATAQQLVGMLVPELQSAIDNGALRVR